MRMVGESDYYDGTAFSSDGRVLSMLVYRRTDGVMRDADIRRALRLPKERFVPSIVCADGSRRTDGILSRLLGLTGFRWDGLEVLVQGCEALFCGILRRGVVITLTTGWSDRRDHVETFRCWSADDYEETLAEHGLMAEGEGHRRWFEVIDVSEHAKTLGIAVATLDPTTGDGRTWRIDAATLGLMDFDKAVEARDALVSLAVWVGGHEPRTRLRVAATTPMRRIQAGGL